MINKFSILNRAKCFSSGIFQIYLVFIPAKNTLNILMARLASIHGNLMECPKKNIEKITESDSNYIKFCRS